MARDTYKYHFPRGNKILHSGITVVSESTSATSIRRVIFFK